MKSLAVLFFIVSFQVQAQSDDFSGTIYWKINKATSLDNSADKFSFNCQFITIGKKIVKWVQSGPAGTTEFVVSSVAGNWENISKPGKIKFQITWEDSKGTIEIERIGAVTLLTMDIGEGGRYKFEVYEFKKEI
jgi:hypothetical protein